MATSKKKQKKSQKKPVKRLGIKRPAKSAIKPSRTGHKAVNKPPVATFRLVPFADRIIVKEVKEVAPERTESGIYLPSSVQKSDKESKRGRVVAVGPGRFENGVRILTNVSVGDLVLYGWGEPIEVDHAEYVVVRESEIMALIRE